MPNIASSFLTFLTGSSPPSVISTSLSTTGPISMHTTFGENDEMSSTLVTIFDPESKAKHIVYFDDAAEAVQYRDLRLANANDDNSADISADSGSFATGERRNILLEPSVSAWDDSNDVSLVSTHSGFQATTTAAAMLEKEREIELLKQEVKGLQNLLKSSIGANEKLVNAFTVGRHGHGCDGWRWRRISRARGKKRLSVGRMTMFMWARFHCVEVMTAMTLTFTLCEPAGHLRILARMPPKICANDICPYATKRKRISQEHDSARYCSIRSAHIFCLNCALH